MVVPSPPPRYVFGSARRPASAVAGGRAAALAHRVRARVGGGICAAARGGGNALDGGAPRAFSCQRHRPARSQRPPCATPARSRSGHAVTLLVRPFLLIGHHVLVTPGAISRRGACCRPSSCSRRGVSRAGWTSTWWTAHEDTARSSPSVTKAFGSAQVLNQAWLQVAAGEAVGLVGVNGAGKTTMMRIAAGLVRPDSGSVRWSDPKPRLRYFGGDMTLGRGVRAARGASLLRRRSSG